MQSPDLFSQENEQANFITVGSVPWAGWEPKYDSEGFFCFVSRCFVFELLLFSSYIILGKQGKTSGF